MSIFNLIRLLGWEIELGPLGTWFGATASTAAVIVALWVALDGRSERTKQESKAVEEAKERALRRASRIVVTTHAENMDSDLRHSWRIFVFNGDDRPIFDLIFHPGLTLGTDGKSVRSTPVEAATSRAVTLKPEGPTHVSFVTADHVGPAGGVKPADGAFFYKYAPALEFIDDDGYRFCWDNNPRDLASGGGVSGSWAIKDDSRANYPEDQPSVGKFYEISRMGADGQKGEIEDLWRGVIQKNLIEFESNRAQTPLS
ncbi:hypothetical protein [Nocardia sp. NPDC050175]|uniref:hypothetical protein n=1 Tax=Nocardia sp. NPDC050175 TaxID=3364317 RepID=UPI0037B5A9F9